MAKKFLSFISGVFGKFPRIDYALRLLILLRQMVVEEGSYLRKKNFFKSAILRKPIDELGNPIPWMNYSVIRLLNDRLSSDFRVYEFGAGYSTLFFQQRVFSVTSVEHSSEWVSALSEMVKPEKTRITHCPREEEEEYIHSIDVYKDPFDVVVVDGIFRVRCAINAFERLSDRGVLVLDDSQRTNYEDIFSFYRKNGFKCLDIEGIKAPGNEVVVTSIFYRVDNCFGL